MNQVRIQYCRSSRKLPPWKFEKVVFTGAGRLRECAIISDPHSKTIEGGRLRELKKLNCNS